MSLPRYAAQRDSNERPIIAALKKVGAQVRQMSRPCDLLVRFRCRVYLMEVDNPDNPYRKRDDAQLEFLREWEVPLVQTADEALRAIGAIT